MKNEFKIIFQFYLGAAGGGGGGGEFLPWSGLRKRFSSRRLGEKCLSLGDGVLENERDLDLKQNGSIV